MSEVANKNTHEEALRATLFERNLDRLPIWQPSARGGETSTRVFELPWIHHGAYVKARGLSDLGHLRAQDKITLAALHQLWAEQGRDPEGLVSFQIIDLVRLMGLSDSNYAPLKASLLRLAECPLEFVNCWDSDPDEYEITAPERLLKLRLIEPKKQKNGSTQLALPLKSTVYLDLALVRNLLGGRGRPVSIALWRKLSDRGLLFEGYIGRILWVAKQKGRATQSKDVFDLWTELGLSANFAKGYGANLKAKMIKDLDLMVEHPASLLGAYSFEKKAAGAAHPRSLNLVLRRKSGPLKIHLQALPAPESKTPRVLETREPAGNPGTRVPDRTERTAGLHSIGAVLEERGTPQQKTRPTSKRTSLPDDANPEIAQLLLRAYGDPARNKKIFKIIAERMPATNLLHQWGRVKEDETIRNPAAVLVNNCLDWLEENDIPHPVKRHSKNPSS